MSTALRPHDRQQRRMVELIHTHAQTQPINKRAAWSLGTYNQHVTSWLQAVGLKGDAGLKGDLSTRLRSHMAHPSQRLRPPLYVKESSSSSSYPKTMWTPNH
eukprot:1159796-Pelagomonas_calceolata.AAC.10